MKKANLVKLYKMLPSKRDLITDSISMLLTVKGDSENIFFKLIEENDDFIDEDNIIDFIDLSIVLSEIGNPYYRKLAADNVSTLLNNDLIKSFYLYDEIRDIINSVVQFSYHNYFTIYSKEEEAFYISFVINEITKFFSKIEDLEDMSTFEEIFDTLSQILCDLNNTESRKYNGEQEKLNRISTFFDVIGDKEVFKLSEYKLYLILSACRFATSPEEMKRLKYIGRFNKNVSDEEFEDMVDGCISDITPITIDKIYKEIEYTAKTEKTPDGAITSQWTEPKHPEKLDKALEKVLNRKENS